MFNWTVFWILVVLITVLVFFIVANGGGMLSVGIEVIGILISIVAGFLIITEPPPPSPPPLPPPPPTTTATQSDDKTAVLPGSLVMNAYYIIPDSSDRELTVEDIRGLTASELRLARNEIYARHGYIFNDESLQKYFDEKPWYTRSPYLEAGEAPPLSRMEHKNVAFIKGYE